MISAAYKQFQVSTEIRRSSPPFNDKKPTNPKILYVGKVKYNIRGRMGVHMGYYEKGSTGGLQLSYWAKNLNLDLQVHVYAFDKALAGYMDAFEYVLAREKMPLIGHL